MSKYLCVQLLSIVLLAQCFSSFAEEPTKLFLQGQDWKEKNPFDKKRYEWQMRAICSTIKNQGDIEFDEYVKIVRILWKNCEVDDSSSIPQLSWEELDFNKDSISGYTIALQEKCHFGWIHKLYFKIDHVQFANSIDLKTNKNGAIVCYFTTSQSRANFLYFISTESSMNPLNHLRVYGINGPGEDCFAKVGYGSLDSNGVNADNPLTDNILLFSRGNITVQMVSHYDDLGCIDLAYRIDGYLKERFEQKKEEISAGESTDETLTSP